MEGTGKYPNDAGIATALHELHYNCEYRDTPRDFRKHEMPTLPIFVTPADRVISAFGGVRATARALGRNPSSISRWRKPREEGGTGGRVPSSLQSEILQGAKSAGLTLTAEDLIVASLAA